MQWRSAQPSVHKSQVGRKFLQLIATARSAGIELRPFFYPLSAMPLYQPYARSCSNSVELSSTGLNLPTSTVVDTSVMEKIAEIFRRALH